MLTRRHLFQFASPLLFPAATAFSQSRGKPPNVVILITDDQGYGDLGCHGNPWIQTPELDKLHAESVRFTNFHSDPLCAPTRAGLLTGQYALRNGVTAATGGWSLLRPGVSTAADLFRRAGYRTGVFGKWHLGENYPLRPSDRGFDESIVCRGGGVAQSPDYFGNDYFDDHYYVSNEPKPFRGYCTDVFFSHAMHFVRQNRERPFFLYLPTNAPHDPFLVDKRYSQPYKDRGVPSPTAEFFGMIQNIDENTGRLLKLLNELRLAENTIFIYMTDNGSSAGGKRQDHPPNWNGFTAAMRAQKGSPYEGGHRVPLFIRWPKSGWKTGRDVSSLTCHLDVLPTLAELCNLQVPADHRFDGSTLAPLLRGTAGFSGERTHFIEHHQTRKDGKYQMENPEPWRNAVALTERWRLVNGRELYDMRLDPGQKKDVSAENTDVVKVLRQRYDQWWKDVSPGFTRWNRVRIGSTSEPVTGLTCFDWHGDFVPSNQVMVRSGLVANGPWALDAEREGLYRIVLRQRPEYVNFAVEADKARLWLNNREYDAPVEKGKSGVAFEVSVSRGHVDLRTELESGGVRRGAYYVDVSLKQTGRKEK